MIVRSEKYPSLVVADLGIRFHDGEAEVSDPGHLERLRRMSGMGVVVPEEPKRRPGRPKKSE
ncbi:hypothetical protein [Microbacterium sp. ZXX196]|uniref:hypothetical protein n=1 Tax=Microbacterium sp. ZXX196 TaxID=2609291 RepID=UPI0012B9682B|nr:hypothetical protein [Microbacterium sp. ZXX196]MTE24832.1 hypothetical protein [Microbacterium sp. ZXX196]